MFLTMALLGGVASPIGSAIGTGLLILIPEWLRFLKSIPGLYLAIYGLAVILIVVFMPDGIWGFVVASVPPRTAWRRRLRSSRRSCCSLRIPAPARRWRSPVSSKHFGGLKAVDGVDFSVARGKVHALIGPNGSGKTTTLNVVSGLYRADSGPHHARRRRRHATCRHTSARRPGLGRTFQNIRLFRSMTRTRKCRDRRRAAGQHAGRRRSCRAHARAHGRRWISSGLARAPTNSSRAFSYGHQRLIEIARALAANPTVLLLDEPAAGLNSSEKKSLHDLLEKIAAQGLTILIIDHDMTLVAGVAQHLTVLNFGRRIADGETVGVLRHPDVVAAYLGAE